MKQVEEAQKAEAEAGAAGTGPAPSTYSSEAPAATTRTVGRHQTGGGGTLASDEALAALREKLTGN